MADDLVSARDLAGWLGVGERTVRELARAGVVPRAARGRYPLRASIAAAFAHLREQAAGRRGDGRLDLAQERAALARAQREATELRTARERGEVIGASEARDIYSGLVLSAKEKLRAVPAAATVHVPGVSPKMARQLGRLIDDALRELADEGVA